jgi:transcriptional regulator with XRE-family HTH domain
MVAMKTKNELDRRVGERLRSRRLKMRLSQTEIGASAGVSFQQVQKYEKGGQPDQRRPYDPICREAWRDAGVFCRRLQRRIEGQRRKSQDGPRHRIRCRQQRGCGGVAGDGADEANAPQINGDARTSTARHGVGDQFASRVASYEEAAVRFGEHRRPHVLTGAKRGRGARVEISYRKGPHARYSCCRGPSKGSGPSVNRPYPNECRAR